jgi:cytochrome c peroxidase
MRLTDAIARIPSLLAGSPERLPALGKVLFFDKELSVNRNEACAFCHMPQTGYQGAIEGINLGGVAQPGSVRTRFSFRKLQVRHTRRSPRRFSMRTSPEKPNAFIASSGGISGICVRPD